MRAEYGQLREGLDAALSRAGAELDQAHQLLDGISTGLDQQNTALEELADTCRGEGLKVPEPLPLDGQ